MFLGKMQQKKEAPSCKVNKVYTWYKVKDDFSYELYYNGLYRIMIAKQSVANGAIR